MEKLALASALMGLLRERWRTEGSTKAPSVRKAASTAASTAPWPKTSVKGGGRGVGEDMHDEDEVVEGWNEAVAMAGAALQWGSEGNRTCMSAGESEGRKDS
jgi:hypothetical protein